MAEANNNNKAIRIICAVLFIVMAVLSALEFTIIYVSLLFAILLLAAAFSIVKSDYYGPRFGIYLSMACSGYAVVEMFLRYQIFLYDMPWGSVATINIPLIILGVVTSSICLKLYYVEKRKFARALEQRKIESPGKYGNCPKCGFDQIKFVDGVVYKCKRCGEIY